MSKVSIIVPVYNGEKSLPRCVESIMNQDYKDLEIILVDDGSKDDSFKVMCEYAKKDERIVPIHKENGGVSSTRNLALDKASGDYIQFIDVDDWLPFDSTKLMVRAMEDENSDMVVGDFYRVIDDKSSKKGSIRKGGVITLGEYADRMLLTPADFYFGVLWNKLYKRQIIEENRIRMDQNISMSEDAIFNLQYLLHVKLISILKSPVYYYVKSEGSLVAQNINIQSIARQKKNVIGYYVDFYKNILSEEDFEARKPIIYGYLVSVSTDGFSLPLIDDEKKVNESISYYHDEDKVTEIRFIKLSNLVFNRLLSSLAHANLLDLSDVKVLYFLYMNKGSFASEDIAEGCELSQAGCTIILAKLTALSYIKISEVNLFEDKKVYYEYIPSAMDAQFEKIEDDYRSLCYDQLSDDDIREYERIRRLIRDNLIKTISKD
ncbi:MAG: glycosyltransferase family 2 protein [Erysipelotrichaceae bacterium]|nr:glycosyltransferase family 2 protein [Erysipelotrichaceae bacterium]